MKRFTVKLALFILFFSIPVLALGGEDDYYYDEDAEMQAAPQTRISLEEAMKKAQEVVPGEVIKAEFEHGRYEIKIFSDNGWLTKVYIDPVDGSIIKPSFYKKRK